MVGYSRLNAFLLLLFASITISRTAAHAENSSVAPKNAVADFYRGNTIHMIIGSASGGGFDVYARLIGRFMTKYIPGNPTIIPQNLAGGGGFAAGNRVAVTAPQDGTYIGAIHPTTIVDPVLGDPRKGTKKLKFAYLGSASNDLEACFLRSDAGAKSFQDGFNTEIVIGAGNQASSTREYPALLKNVLGMKLKIVGGYSGTAQIMLAMERGEVQAMCGAGYLSTVQMRPSWFTNKFVKIISYQGSKLHPEIAALKDVKPAVYYAKSDEQRTILNLYDSQEQFGRPYVTGGAVPPERVRALRTAFMAALNDPELRKQAEDTGLEISPVSGSDVQGMVAAIYNAPPEILKKTRQALGYE
jgi:tripartite-type tricarboxylate transporter receptor subunit TctC